MSLPFPLIPARVHEASGPGATAFAVMLSAQSHGQVLWIAESWLPEALSPAGLSGILDPARLILARTKDQTDSLAVAEEAMKDGAIPFVIIEITRPLDLREGRRLQLAARAGQATGLCLIPEGMGSNAAETRWLCHPVHDPEKPDSTRMSWQLIKNKRGTTGVWHVRWDASTHRIDVVSPVALRPGDPAAAG